MNEVSNLNAQERPVLYSFRRCPYAMRARLAILSSGLEMELREVVLRDKPDHMREISPKATVPVLQLQEGHVLEESLDIMLWALGEQDPENLLFEDGEKREELDTLIRENDWTFKYHLDRYKYPNRYDDAPAIGHRDAAVLFLEKLNVRLSAGPYLFGNKVTLADYAIFPFIRQFANVDREWFDALDLPHLHTWLAEQLGSSRFERIMRKEPQWMPDADVTLFP